MSEEQAVYDVPQVRINSQQDLMTLAATGGIPVERLAQLWELQEKIDAKQAKQEYTEAMAALKRNPPKIIKDRINAQFKSKYASIDSIINGSMEALGQNDFSVNFMPEQDKETLLLTVTCILTHKGGHSEKATMCAPPDSSGSKNALQQIKSTLTYLRGATFEAVTGFAGSDANMDDDGNEWGKKPVETITEDQVKEIEKLLAETGTDEAAWLKLGKIEKIADLPKARFAGAKAFFDKKKANATRTPGQEG